MRVVLGSVAVSCLTLALACVGPQGPTGPQGDPGPQGETGTFSGVAKDPVTFDAGVTINGGLTINGADPFAASMVGLAPAVFGYNGGTTGTSAGHLSCDAPNSIDLTSILAPSFGEIIYTSQGRFNLAQGGPAYMGCPNNVYCAGPLTFFLSSPSAQTIVLQGDFDDGPSKIYVDGSVRAIVSNRTFSQGLDVPEGPFALSLIACSNNGYSIVWNMTNQWIATYNLRIDVDRTFHRNGK